MEALAQTTTSRVEFPKKLDFLFVPARYKVAHGGRGGSKSWGFARALLVKGSEKPLRILCAREYQNSIRDSVHALLSDQIDQLGFSGLYLVQKVGIRGVNGTDIIFAGIKNDPHKIKSLEGVDICWVEEAEKVSEDSWQILIPTIRKEGSEIWVTFNPDLETDPTYKKFIANRPPPGAVVRKIGWRDNPWFPEVLRQEKDWLASYDKDAYDHVWEGEPRSRSDAQVMGGKCFIEWFTPAEDWDGPYYGADWGFANDPTVLVKMWIHDGELLIEQEAYGLEVELDDIPELFDRIGDGRKHIIRADNSRPETISHVRAKGFPRLRAAEKWPGSVEDGIAFLRSFKRVVIHPRCKHTAEESRLYCYKVDRLTGDVLPDIVDKHNHCWDSIRYGLEPLIRKKGSPGIYFLGRSQREEEE